MHMERTLTMSYYSRHRDECMNHAKQCRGDNNGKAKEGQASYRADTSNTDKDKSHADQYRDAHTQHNNEQLARVNCGSGVSRNCKSRHKESAKCQHAKP